MLDVTTYRRKQKYAKPIGIMRELYHEYNKTRSRKWFSKDEKYEKDPLGKLTLSMEKFNKCLQQFQTQSTRLSKYTEKEEKLFRMKKIQYLPPTNTPKQLGKFNSHFSKTVRFLKLHPHIQQTLHQNEYDGTQINQPENGELTMPTNLLFQSKKTQMRHPTPLFLQMKRVKQQNEAKINIRKRKLRKTRQDWILNNLYHKSQQMQEQLPPTKFQIKIKTRQFFQQTKQNIFPTHNTIY